MKKKWMMLLWLHVPMVVAIVAAIVARAYHAPSFVGWVIGAVLILYVPVYSAMIRRLF